MPVILHGFFFMYIIYKLFHYFILRFLVMGLGLGYPVASVTTFVLVGIAVGLLFGRHRRKTWL